MPPEKKVSRKRERLWNNDLVKAIMIVVATGLVGTFLSEMNSPHDFSIFVDPVSIKIPIQFAGNLTYNGIVYDPVNAKNETLLFSTPNSDQMIWVEKVSSDRFIIKCKALTTAYVRNTNWLSILGFKQYDHPVFLEVNTSKLPDGISTDFTPAEARPDFDTSLTIETLNVTPGKYPITIYGHGGDTTLRTCTCIVDIKYRTKIQPVNPSDIYQTRPKAR